MIASENDLFGSEERNPTLCFERLACFVDDDDVEVLVSELEAACAVEGCEDDFASADESSHALLFSLAVLFP